MFWPPPRGAGGAFRLRTNRATINGRDTDVDDDLRDALNARINVGGGPGGDHGQNGDDDERGNPGDRCQIRVSELDD